MTLCQCSGGASDMTVPAGLPEGGISMPPRLGPCFAVWRFCAPAGAPPDASRPTRACHTVGRLAVGVLDTPQAVKAAR